MKYISLIAILLTSFSYGEIDVSNINAYKLEAYQDYTPFLDTENGRVRPRIMVFDYYGDRCFYVLKKVRKEDRQYRNCKFLLKGFPEDLRDANMPESNIVDFEKSDENSETEVNLIKHINIKENGDIVFTYKRGVGAKSALYFCTQKLNHENEGLAENPISECEFIGKGDFDGEFKKVYKMYQDQFYPAR